MTSKRTIFALGAVAVVVIVVASMQVWVSGTVDDSVLAHTEVTVKGSKAAPACIGAAFVGAAAVLAALTTGRIARWISAVLVLLAGLLALGSALWVLRDPGATLASRAAEATGHTGGLQIEPQLSAWIWVGVVGAALLVVTGILCVAGVRGWSGLSSSYDAPTGQPAQSTMSPWDRLSAGDDPTSDDEDRG